MATAAVTIATQEADWDVPEQVGLWQDAWVRFRRNRLAVAGLMIIVLLVLIAASGPLLVRLGIIADPLTQNAANSYRSLGAPHHPLGTDNLGRDLLSRLIFGAQISLSIGIGVQVIVLAIAGSVGLTAGYFGGWVDNLLMRITDIMYAFPDLLFLLIIMATLGPSFWNLFIGIGVVGWVGLARLIRGQVLSIKEREYVEAARASGSSPFKIIVKHLLPNSLGPIIVTLTFGIPAAIFLEAVLSYLGVGIRPPQASWGVMVNDGFAVIFSYPHLVIFPALGIALTMLSFNFVGDGLRDALDPRMRR